MEEQNIEGLQCMLCYNNNRAEKKVCWSKIKHNSFQWLEMKNMDLSRLYLIEKPEECHVKFLSSQKIDSVHVSILHPPCYRYIC